MDIELDWDESKRQINRRKHGIDFAVEVFYDDLACTMADPDHHAEQRFVTIGLDAFGRLLVVVYAQTDRGVPHPHHLGAAGHGGRAPSSSLRAGVNHA